MAPRKGNKDEESEATHETANATRLAPGVRLGVRAGVWVGLGLGLLAKKEGRTSVSWVPPPPPPAAARRLTLPLFELDWSPEGDED